MDDDAKKRAAIKRFVELDRRGVVEHDWSEHAKTGLVKIRLALETVKPEGHA